MPESTIAQPIHNLPAFHPNAAHLLWAAAELRPSSLAIVDGDSSVTFEELRDLARGASAILHAHGAGPGDRVGILLDRGAQAAAAYFGALAVGAIAININETLRARQVEHVLSHSDTKVLLSSKEALDRLGRPLEGGTRVETTLISPVHDAISPLQRTGQDPAQIIYTSGSTGLPKGVLISHGNLWSGAMAVAAYTRLVKSDRIASLLPFSFDYGLNQLLTSVLAGATLVVEHSPLATTIVSTLRKQAITVLPCVPPLWLQLLAATPFRSDLPALRVLTNTGGHLPREAVRALRKYHPHASLYLMYGLTEAFRSTYLPPEETDAHPDSIGRAIPGAQIMVLTPAGREAAPGEEGELVHRGPTVALGYWNDPQATAKVYRSNPLVPAGTPEAERVVFSGDMVRRDADGLLYYVGRRDRIIKSMGFRVSPDEVVSVLYASGLVVEAVVTAEPDDVRGERIIAHVVLRPEATPDQLKRYAGIELPRFMQPTRIVPHERLPRTTSGKHDPELLRQLVT